MAPKIMKGLISITAGLFELSTDQRTRADGARFWRKRRKWNKRIMLLSSSNGLPDFHMGLHENEAFKKLLDTKWAVVCSQLKLSYPFL